MGSVEEEESLIGGLDSQGFFCGLEGEEETVIPTNEIFCSGDPSLSTLTSSSSSLTTTITTSKSHTTKMVTAADGISKKQKKGVSASLGTIKVRTDRLGARISALQQLVSPYGKSDTASVLHEALGYIRFLHDQVQVLSSPYLRRLPITASPQEEAGEEWRAGDLKSRGLCLVPITCTEEVANDNGADLWSPAMGSNAYTKH